MDNSLKSYTSFLVWFFILLVFESVVLLRIFGEDLFLFKLLVNYLFVLTAIALIFEKANKRALDPFSPLLIFSFFYLLLFGFRSLDLLTFRQSVIQDDQRYYIYALVYAILGLHFFYIGYFSKLGTLLFKNIKPVPKKWSNARFKIMLISYTLLSLFSFIIILKLSGGTSYYFRNIRDAMVSITAGKTIFFMLVLLIKIPLLIWFCSLVDRRRFSFSFLLYAGLAAFLLISLGERGHFISLLVSMMVCYNYLNKKVRLVSIFSVLLVLLSFLVILGQYRDFTERNYRIKKAGFNVRIGIAATYNYFIGHFDQLRHVKDVIKHVPDNLDFQYGKTFANLLVKPIPSAIWEGKPRGAGKIITESLYPKAQSLNVRIAPSLLGELYLNFHLAGVIAGMFLFGVFCKALYSLLIRSYESKNMVLLYAFSLPFVLSELRGDFSVVTSFLIFNLLCLVAALKYVTINNCT